MTGATHPSSVHFSPIYHNHHLDLRLACHHQHGDDIFTTIFTSVSAKKCHPKPLAPKLSGAGAMRLG